MLTKSDFVSISYDMAGILPPIYSPHLLPHGWSSIHKDEPIFGWMLHKDEPILVAAVREEGGLFNAFIKSGKL